MDYKNILEGARPFFQGLPSPSQNAAAASAPSPATAAITLPLVPLAIPNSHVQQESSVIRSKYEGLGATLSQIYGTGVSSLRTNPVSSLSPQINSYPTKSPTPHLTLRGGSSSVVSSVGHVGSSSPLLPAAAGQPNHKSGSGSAGGSSQTTMVVRRESPLDLSVKTVRQSADSSTSTPTDSGTTNSTSTGIINIPQLNNNRSLCNSGASTPINTTNTATNNCNSGGSNHVSSVIAAVVNSTTGRDKEYDSLKQPPSVTVVQKISTPHTPQPHLSAHERVEVPSRPPSQQPPPGFTNPSHHLFGHYPTHSPVPPNVAGKPYQYLPQPPGPEAPNFRSPGSAPPTSKAFPGTPATATPTSASSSSHQQQRPSSVIPPYNPPTPNFGVYHQAAGSHGPIHPAFSHHSHSPYATYQSPHIQQPHQQQVHYPDGSVPYYHNPYAHAAANNPPTTTGPSTNSINTSVNGLTKPTEVNSYLRNSAPNNHAHPQGAPTPGLHPQYHQSNSNKEQAHGQHYGLPPIPAPASSYHHYPQYLPQHLVQNVQIPSHPSPNTNSSSHQHSQHQQPNAQGQQSQTHQYHPGYSNSHMPQSRYGSPQSQQQTRFTAPVHVPSPFSYQQPPPPPRGSSPASTNQQPSPSPHHYSPMYSPQLAGPRQPTPPSQSPTPKQKKTAAVAKAQNENSNSASSTNSGTSSHHRNSHGSKGGSSRKNVLNLLRNSLETRIHEKQEKEKTQFNHQTWSFHGRKITLPPLSKPGDQSSANGPSGSISGGGSILTGLSSNGPSSGLNGTSITGTYPDIFGINQRNSHNAFDDESRAMTFHGSQELSPNADNSLSSLQRIRTKAEKKQLFPNLLSQIEQENSNKHQNPTAASRFGKSGQPKSVFDFDDEEDDSKVKLGRSNSIGSNKGSTPPHSSQALLTSTASVPQRKSGSKKFTSKLTKAKDYFNSTSGLTSNAIDAINAVIASASLASQANASTSNATPVIGPASTETKAVMSSFSAEPLDSFWAACDSFVDDLAKNPVSVKSKRGGLWAKMKAQQNKSKEKEDGNNEKTGSRKGSAPKRVRRNSSEEDEDFEIDPKSEEEEVDEDDEENSVDAESTHSHDSSDAEDDDLAVGKRKKKVKPLDDDDEDDNSSTSSTVRKNTRSASQNKRGNSLVGSKRKNSSAASSHGSPAKKGKTSKRNSQKKRTSRGIKVGNHTLRERRATNLGLDLVEDDISGSSLGSASDDDSDDNVSYSISDDDHSEDSEASSDSSNSDDSDSDEDDDSDDERNSDDSETVGKGRKKRTSTAGGSTKGKSSPVSKRKSSDTVKARKGKSSKSKNNKKSKKTKTKKVERKCRSLRSGRGGSVTRSSRRSSLKKSDTRKLRPQRSCASAKAKDVVKESVQDGGSSEEEEEWIMHGDLTKKKSRVVFGDGSDFKKPGWEEELIDFKRKLRMPSKLIRVAKPSSLTSSLSGVKDKDDMGNSPAKENKSPAKAAIEETKPKGRSGKGGKDSNRTPAKDGKSKSDKKAEPDSLDEPAIEKVVEKMTAAKKLLNKKLEKCADDTPKSPEKATKGAKGTPKKSKDAAASSSAAASSKTSKETAKGATKSAGKSKGSKSTSKDELTPSVKEIVKTEKEPQLLPTPGPAGLKFNKKMSIKSVFGVDPAESSPSTPAVVPKAKKVLRRNKFKSGFDYLRKKKKPTPTPDGTPPAPKRAKMSQEKNMSEEDVQVELRGWVLNKGSGETVLHRAARLGYVDVAAYSLEYGIGSPNCKDNAGYTPLHECCIRGTLEVARVLLLYGANPSTAAPGGIRPLHEACENGYVELVRLLISYGADPLLATYAGQAPLELADQHNAVKSLLTQHIQDVQGKTEKLWQFRGSGIWVENSHDNGYDVTADPPILASIDTIDGFEFEASEAPLPPLYLLKGDTPYVLVQDLVTYLGVPRERLLKNHPAAELVELNSNDFLEEAHCCHLLGEKFNLNSPSDLLSLIKYDDRVKKLLNIESCIIK